MVVPLFKNPKTGFRWLWFLIITIVFLLLLELFLPTPPVNQEQPELGVNAMPDPRGQTHFHAENKGLLLRRAVRSTSASQTASEIVAGKLLKFAQSRRAYAHALALRYQTEVPEDVERFFDALETGKWESIETAFSKISGGDSSAGQNGTRSDEVNKLWPAIIDAYGVAEQVHLWPPQKLLNYGNGILESLKPGMVYVGGTDTGRWIPELLNDTSDGERHVIITQNGLADAAYLDYLRLQYDDRLVNLSKGDAERVIEEYKSGAHQRLEHDLQFPDQPKQLREREDITLTNGKLSIGGQVAVMAINEQLLQTLLQNNPNMTFALQESIALKGTYKDALPLGPLMELHTSSDQAPFSAERAAQSRDYWRTTLQSVLGDGEAMSSSEVLKAYSHDAEAAANLLAAHEFTSEAEQTYRMAAQAWPENQTCIVNLAELVAKSGREEEANGILDNFSRNYPDQRKDLEGAYKLIISTTPKKP